MNIDKIKDLYQNKNYTVKEIADKLGISFWKVYESMRKNSIPRRNYSEANYVKYDRYNPRFTIKENIDFKDGLLKISGVMLYWAEGYKGGFGVDFANSDPEMIKLFLSFLRNICGINETRLRVYLYTHEGQDIEDLKRFWNKITKIPLDQFSKPYIKKVNGASNKSDKMPNGLIHIRYHDKKLLNLILDWINEYISSFKSPIYGQVLFANLIG